MLDTFEFSCSVPVIFERGCTDTLGSRLEADGHRDAFVVIDPDLQKLTATDSIFRSLEDRDLNYTAYTDVEPNPKANSIDDGGDAAERFGADCIVAIGGGSTIDTAKGIALVATHNREIGEFQRTKDGEYVTTDTQALPVYTIPTTVGTGSEVTSGIVVTDVNQNKKIVVGAAGFSPERAFLDPSLLQTLPRKVVSATGMDSFTQAVESYIASDANPVTESLSIRAVKMVGANIRPAVARRDAKSLERMQVATMMGALAFDNCGLGLVHGISHPISAHYDTPHGITNAVLLPHVLEFNLIAAVDKYAKMARVLGIETAGQPNRRPARAFVDAVQTLNEDLDIPARLRELGVEQDMIAAIAEETHASGAPNPREYDTDDVVEILKRAY